MVGQAHDERTSPLTIIFSAMACQDGGEELPAIDFTLN